MLNESNPYNQVESPLLDKCVCASKHKMTLKRQGDRSKRKPQSHLDKHDS